MADPSNFIATRYPLVQMRISSSEARLLACSCYIVQMPIKSLQIRTITSLLLPRACAVHCAETLGPLWYETIVTKPNSNRKTLEPLCQSVIQYEHYEA